MESLFAQLVTELERPRALAPQVIRHLTDTYDLERDGLGAFLDGRLPALAEDELDLILSPLFTPKLADQALFAALLGRESVATTEWPALVQRLAERPTVGQLVTADGTTHRFNLQPVTLERYVHRLRLEGAVADSTFALIQNLFAPGDRPLPLAVARRAIWNSEARREILQRQLASAADPSTAIADMVELLRLMETAEPADTADVLARIPAWEEVLRGQIADAGQPKVFFNEQVRYLHGGGRDQRSASVGTTGPKQAELEFLGRLRRTLTV